MSNGSKIDKTFSALEEICSFKGARKSWVCLHWHTQTNWMTCYLNVYVPFENKCIRYKYIYKVLDLSFLSAMSRRMFETADI